MSAMSPFTFDPQNAQGRRKTPERCHVANIYNKGDSEHFHQEIAYLKNFLEKKEAILASTKQELQKAWHCSFKYSQQNKQLTQVNGQMFAELCMLREKFKLLEHEQKQMSAVFRFKRAELEETVRDLSQQLKSMHQRVTKEAGQSKNPLQCGTQHLSSIRDQNCYFENPGEVSNEGKNSPRTNLSKAIRYRKRVLSRRGLTSNGASHLSTKDRGGERVFMPTLDQIDQSDASFIEPANPKEVVAGDICKEADSLSRANGSTNEEASKGKRTCLRRQLTGVSYQESPIKKKVKQEAQARATSTLDQIDQCDASFSREETIAASCDGYACKEADSSSKSNMSISEEDSNERRVSLRRRSANISYKEPLLNTKLRRPGSTLPIQKLFQSDKNNSSSTVLKTAEKARKGDVSNEAGISSKILVSANEENKNGRVLNLKENTKREEWTVQTPGKVGKDHDLCFDVPHLKAIHIDLSETYDGHKMKDVTSKATKFQQQQIQETGPYHAAALNNALEATEARSSTGNPVLKAVDPLAFSKKIPLDKVGDIQEFHFDVPQTAAPHLQDHHGLHCGVPQNCALPPAEVGITSKETKVQQQQVQETASCNTSSLDAALDAAEVRRSSSGRPVQKARSSTGNPVLKAVEPVAFSKKIPLDKVGDVQEFHFDVPQTAAPHLQDLHGLHCGVPQNCACPPAEEVITSKATKVQQRQVQETASFNTSSLDAALDAAEVRWSSSGRPIQKARSSTGNPVLKAVEPVAFPKKNPLDKVGDVQEFHFDVPQTAAPHLQDLHGLHCGVPQNCALPTAEEGITSKATKVQQQQVQETATFNTSSLDAAEVRRSSSGRPVRKAKVTVASYKEIPLNMKMRRSQ